MPSWGDVLDGLRNAPNPMDAMRRRYLGIMAKYTNRNVIAYYSAFIQKPGLEGTGIDDSDKNAFMQTIFGLDKSRGLDLILHTPGGQIAAAESIVYYLKEIFHSDIRVFVPQIAMSAGTMIALSSKEIVMGKHSNLGPIDPQFGGISCAGIIEEFEEAKKEVAMNPSMIQIWGPIISKYHPTFVGDCKKAIEWSETTVKRWLMENMFSEEENPEECADMVVNELSSHNKTYSHQKHIHIDELKKLGVKIKALEDFEKKPIEDCEGLQDCVLTIHHAFLQCLTSTNAIKIVENHNGKAMITNQERPN